MFLEALALSVAFLAAPHDLDEVGGRVVGVRQEASTGVISGTIRGRHLDASRPLPHASVELVAGEVRMVAYADSLGAYRLERVPSGSAVLRVQHVGYAPLTVEAAVPPGGVLRLDLELEWRPIPLPPLHILVDPLDPAWTRSPPTPAEIAELSMWALEASPGLAEAGLAAAIRSIPGGDPSDPSDVLFMRGSAADMKLVLLDGAPVYTPFHVGGLVRPFDPSALGGASLYLGGAPSRYDGGLSYILDVRTRDPSRDRLRASGSADLLSASARVEGPVADAGAFLVSARGLHELDLSILAGGGRPPYGYRDALARLDLDLAPGHSLSATGFWNRESVRLDIPSALRDEGLLVDDPFGPRSGLLAAVDEMHDPSWGNASLSARYAGMAGETGVLVVASAGRYAARLPLGDSIPLFARGASRRLRLTADFSHPWEDGAIHYGGTVDRLLVHYEARDYSGTGVELVETDGEGVLIGAYAEVQRPLSPRVTLRGGMRLDHFSDGGGVRAAPRVSLAWSVTDDALLTLAAGRYHQYARAPSQEMEVALGDPLATIPDTELLPVAGATHLLVSLEQSLTTHVRLGVDGFFKSFSGVSGVQGGNLRASGMDLRVSRTGERSAGWIGYSLQWFWNPDESGQVSGTSFAGRHLLSAGMLGNLDQRFAVDLRVSYGNGLPYTTIPLGDGGVLSPTERTDARVAGNELLNQEPGLSGGPPRDFLRVDAELSATLEPRWRGRSLRLIPYVRVLNALNRRDALFFYFEPWRDDSIHPLAEMSLLPVIGMEWRF